MRCGRCLVAVVSTFVALAGCGRKEAAAPPPEAAIDRLAQGLVVPGDVLLVVGSSSLSAGDQKLRDRLTGNLGFTVTVKEAGVAVTGDAAGKALVLISESAPAAAVGTKFKTVTQSVMSLQPASFGNLALTGTSSGVNFGTRTGQTQVAITNASHAMAAGLSGTQTVTTSAQTFGWGQPAAGAESVATIVGSASQVAIFGYQTGVTMAQSFVAPGRRVGWFASQLAVNAFPSSGTGPGWSLFDAAVRWATKPEVLLLANSTTASAGEAALKARLTNQLSMAVRVVAITNQNQSTIAAQVPPARLVLLSDSVPAGTAPTVATSLVNVATPILSLQAAAFANLQLTGPGSGSDWGTTTGQTKLDIVKPTHSLAAGLTGSGATAPVVTTAAQTFAWGSTFGAGVVKVANVLGNTSRVAVFGYPKGASRRNGSAAPARRVGFFGSNAAFAGTVPNSSTWALFEAAARWAISEDFDATCEVALDGAPCNDGNPCTSESCQNQLCAITNRPAGTSCADATLCNGAETCNASGVCQSGTAVSCDDKDPCTTDSCAPATGVCSSSGRDPVCAAIRVNVTIHPAEYTGRICLGEAGCTTGTPLTMSVAPGYYTITTPAAGDAAGSDVLGHVTVHQDGSLVADSDALRSLTVSGSTLTAKVAPVTVAFGGFKGTFYWYEVGSARETNPTKQLLHGRRYLLQDYVGLGLTDTSPHLGLVTVSADGTQVTVDPVLGQYVTPVGLTLTVKVAPVTINYNGYLGALAWWEVQAGRGPTMTTTLMVGRRYRMQAYYTTGLDDSNDGINAPNSGVAVSLDGTTVTLDAGGADRYFTASGLTMTARVVPVTVEFNGYSGRLTWWEVVEVRGPTMTTPMIIGRRYLLQAHYTAGLTDNSPNLGTVAVAADGSSVTPSLGTTDRHFAASGRTLTARVAPVTVDFAGYKGRISIWEHIEFRGPRPSTTLLVARRYALQTPYAGTPSDASNPWVSPFPDAYGLGVDAQGTTLSLDTFSSALFTHAGTTLRARVSQVQIDPGAYASSVCVSDVQCANAPGPFTTNLLLGRQYGLDNGGYFTVQPSGSCGSSSVALGSGQATLQCQENTAACNDDNDCAPANACFAREFCASGTCTAGAPTTCDDGDPCTADSCGLPNGCQHSAPDPTCVAARKVTITIQKNGYPGHFCVGPTCYAESFELTRGTYNVGALYTTDAAGSPHLGTITITPAGGVVLGGGLTAYFQLSGTTLSATTRTVTVDRAGYRGPLHIGGLGYLEGTGDAVTMPLLVGRRYTLMAIWTMGENNEPGGFSSYGFEVSSGGTGLILHDRTAEHFEAPVGLTVRAKTLPVTIDLKGALVTVGVGGVGDVGPTTSPTLTLLKGRRYSTISWWATGLDNLTWNLGNTDYPLKVGMNGTLALDGGGGSFTISGTTLTARVADVTITRNQAVGEICIGRIVCALPVEVTKVVRLLAGRRYEVPGLYNTPPVGALLTVPPAGACSPPTMLVAGEPVGFACMVQAGEQVQLVAEHSGKCLEATGALGKAVQKTCNGSPRQQWIRRPVQGGEQLMSAADGTRCLGIPGASQSPGTDVQLSSCSEVGHVWTLSPVENVADTYSVIAANSGLCMDVDGGLTVDGARILQWACSGLGQQRWQLRPAPADECVGATDGAVCGGGDKCSPSVCSAGVCVATPGPVIDDGDPCTIDQCNPSVGVQHIRNLECGAQAPPILSSRDAPAVLTATRVYSPPSETDGISNPEAPITFNLPDKIPVTVGNSGNGRATLSFTPGGGSLVRCHYRGGASQAHPVAEIDVVRGRWYLFETCDQQPAWRPGTRIAATSFSLHVESGDAQDSAARTTIRLALGEGGCSDILEEPISPEETITIRDGFSWSTTQPVNPTDAEGRPTLWYGLVYIENRDQLAALDATLIHHSTLPLFNQMGRWAGKCGAFDLRGDGKGIFLHVLIPGAVYNKIREFAVGPPDPVEGPLALFRVLKLIDVPEAGARNADGSVSFDYLQRTGFLYRGLTPSTVGAVTMQQQPIFGAVWRFVQDAVAAVAKPIVNTIVDVIGFLERLAFGTANVEFELSVLNRDPAFDRQSPMIRGWGPRAGQELTLPGVEVSLHFLTLAELVKLGLDVSTAISLASPEVFSLTSPYHARTNGEGIAYIKVPKQAMLLAVCIAVENYAARFSSFLITNPHCDFTFGDPTKPGYFPDDQARMDWKDNNIQLHALNQLTDGAAYMKQVVMKNIPDWTPYKAEVLYGPVAELLTSSGSTFASCFGFPSLASLGVTALVQLLASSGVASFASLPATILTSLATADIVMADNASTTDSRVTMTHEYGHFALCSLIVERDPVGASFNGLSQLIADTIINGKNTDPSNHPRIMNEAFADFFASQVAGGMNYVDSLPGSQWSAGNGLCIQSPCAEANVHPNPTGEWRGAGYVDIYENFMLFRDAFDGHRSFGGDRPTDGDLWSPSGTGSLQWSPNRYADSCLAGLPTLTDSCDEHVALDGPKIYEWIDRWQSNDATLTKENFVRGLMDTVRANGATWCQACELMAIHTRSLATLPQDMGLGRFPIREYWGTCVQNEFMSRVLGPPPEPSLAMSSSNCAPCPVGTVSNVFTGICESCSSHRVAINNECFQCAPGAIEVNNQCVQCNNGGMPAPNEDRCDCPSGFNDANGLCTDCGNGPHQGLLASGVCGVCPEEQIVSSGVCTACPTGQARIIELNGTQPVPTEICDTCPPSFDTPTRFWQLTGGICYEVWP